MRVYNTLSGQKEEFLPPGSEVKMYVCGVTPYSDAHLGHAMSQAIFDVIRRYLQFRDYKVKYVQNITDIDDKIIDRANSLGISTQELAGKYTDSFLEDMKALNVSPPDIQPKATEEIPKMIEVVQGLVDKGFAYPAKGSVYFRVRNVPDYGKLSHRTLEAMTSADGATGGKDKEHPMDFVLWKAAKPGEPAWDSPWGKGRPGWHIECSSMSLRYLGNSIDIHGGGQDLIFPHHENEIAQSESFTGVKPFVKYWLHNGMVQLGAEKMSKSLGNLITIKEALTKYSADALRIFILNSHYRSPLSYSEEALEAAEKGADRLRQAANTEYQVSGDSKKVDTQIYHERFVEAMDDDFNTAQALASLFDLARDINKAADSGRSIEDARMTLKELAGDILGLKLKLTEEPTPEKKLHTEATELHNQGKSSEIPMRIEGSLSRLDKRQAVFTSLYNRTSYAEPSAYIKLESETNLYKMSLESLRSRLNNPGQQDYESTLQDLRNLASSADASTATLINIREQLRKEKQWQLADEIRTKLDEVDIVLEDTPKGTVWRIKR